MITLLVMHAFTRPGAKLEASNTLCLAPWPDIAVTQQPFAAQPPHTFSSCIKGDYKPQQVFSPCLFASYKNTFSLLSAVRHGFLLSGGAPTGFSPGQVPGIFPGKMKEVQS